MKIIIDMQGLQTGASGHRGVGRYTESLVSALLKIGEEDIWLALNGRFAESVDVIRDSFDDLISQDRIVTWQQLYPTSVNQERNRRFAMIGETVREKFLHSLDPDVIFSTNLQEGYHDDAVTGVPRDKMGVTYCSTLHDLVPLSHSSYLQDDVTRQWYFEKIEAAKRSDILVTVSESSKSEIVTRLGIDASQVHVIQNGYDKKIFNQLNATPDQKELILARYGVKGPFIFYIGGCDEHKNIIGLLRAYAASREAVAKNVRLVLGGRDMLHSEAIKQEIRHLGILEKVILPGFISLEHLPAFYGSAVCFVFPSAYEGFGLPVLEALACGAAVIGSKTPAVSEILGVHGTFDPHDFLDIARLMDLAIGNSLFRESLIEARRHVASRYSWEESAKKLLELWRKNVVLASRREKRPNLLADAISAVRPMAFQLPHAELSEVSQSIAESFGKAGKNRLYLDVSTVVRLDHKTGIQRVTRGLAAELLKSGISNFETDLVYTDVGAEHFISANRYMWNTFGALRPALDETIEFYPGDILVFLDLHPGVAISKKAYVKNLRRRGIKVFHVVYDILPIVRPETFWDSLCQEFRCWAEVISSSDGAICISRAVANDLTAFLLKYAAPRSAPFKIDYFHLGADIGNSAPTKGLPVNAEVVMVGLAKRPSFLMVGTIEPRKAHRQTLAAFELLWSMGSDVNLVIVGKFGWGMRGFDTQLLGHVEANNRLFWLSGISDEFLDMVYASCTCLIAASEGEGFGLPLIEASRHKLPILARDITVFREVAGPHACYFFDDDKPLTISSAVTQWLRDFSVGVAPLSVEMPYLTWTQSKDAFLEVLQKNSWLIELHGQGNVCPGNSYVRADGKLRTRQLSQLNSDAWPIENGSEYYFSWGESTGQGQLRLSMRSSKRVGLKILLDGVKIHDEVLKCGQTQVRCNLENLFRGENKIFFYLTEDGESNLASGMTTVAIDSFSIATLPEFSTEAAEGHDSNALEWTGFNDIEDGFRWTAGAQSELTFNWAGSSENKSLRLLYGTLGLQRIGLRLNGVTVYSEAVECWKGEITAHLTPLRRGYNTLQFELPDSRQPNDIDRRYLAVALFEIEIL